MLSEGYNPATNLIQNLFFVGLPVMATEGLLTERSEKTKCGGMEKRADCLGMKEEGSMLDLTEGDCICERSFLSVFPRGTILTCLRILLFRFLFLEELLVGTNGTEKIIDSVL